MSAIWFTIRCFLSEITLNSGLFLPGSKLPFLFMFRSFISFLLTASLELELSKLYLLLLCFLSSRILWISFWYSKGVIWVVPWFLE